MESKQKEPKSSPILQQEAWLAKLDQLRRTSGLSIDAKGQWWHEQDRFEHERIIQTLNQGLAWVNNQDDEIKSECTHQFGQSPSVQNIFETWQGEAILNIGQQWCYIGCDFTPFLISKIFIDHTTSTLKVKLNTQEVFNLGSLALRDDILFSRLTSHRLARFSVQAQIQIIDWLHETDSGLSLIYKHNEWPIWI